MFEKDVLLRKSLFTLYSDYLTIFICARKVFTSIELKDNYEISIDGTSYYFFLRIYYDSLAVVLHLLMRKLYPTSITWPPTKSFNSFVKWLSESSNSEISRIFKDFNQYKYLDVFIKAREIRNQLKTPSSIPQSRRLVHEKMNTDINIETLKKDIVDTLFSLLSMSDYLGNYFLRNLKELKSLKRIDYDQDQYPVAFLHSEERKIYIWFTS